MFELKLGVLMLVLGYVLINIIKLTLTPNNEMTLMFGLTDNQDYPFKRVVAIIGFSLGMLIGVILSLYGAWVLL